jgi:hypothetical protein
VMKINQLFVKHVDLDMILEVLKCFNLKGLHDQKMFCKYDMVEFKTVEKLNTLKDKLASYYIPCKARLYLENLTEKKSITVLKQLIRLHLLKLWSKEKNHHHKKIIFYQLVSENFRQDPITMKYTTLKNIVTFDG